MDKVGAEKRYKVGYTQGVFDMFHVGHLNLIRNAKIKCEHLIVGVNSDQLVLEYKNKKTVVSETDRAKIISELKSVDAVEIVSTLDKRELFEKFHFDAVFIGDDWKGNDRWRKTEKDLSELGVDVVYLPHTPNVSSTGLRGKERVDELDGNIPKINKEYCMSSYLAFRYVTDANKCFKKGLDHKDHIMIPQGQKKSCKTAEDIDRNIREILERIGIKTVGVFLSGGIDSAILASYMPKGTKAYTSKCIGTNAVDETKQARKYCDTYDLEHIIVDVTWDDYETAIDELALFQGSPIIPNEPQAYKIAKRAKADGIEILIHGDCADIVFGGMSKMLSKNWTLEEWIERSIYIRPEKVLKNPADIYLLYEKYRKDKNLADNEGFINDVYGRATAGAMTLPCRALDIEYIDPYEEMYMTESLDFKRIRSGESKYLLRELYKMRYPELDIPEKKPMSRPAEAWMAKWGGTKRAEFKENCISGLTGEQKLLVYSLERFLDIIDA